MKKTKFISQVPNFDTLYTPKNLLSPKYSDKHINNNIEFEYPQKIKENGCCIEAKQAKYALLKESKNVITKSETQEKKNKNRHKSNTNPEHGRLQKLDDLTTGPSQDIKENFGYDEYVTKNSIKIKNLVNKIMENEQIEAYNTEMMGQSIPNELAKALYNHLDIKTSNNLEVDMDYNSPIYKTILNNLHNDKHFNIVDICKKSHSQHPSRNRRKELLLFPTEENDFESVDDTNNSNINQTFRNSNSLQFTQSLDQFLTKKSNLINLEKEQERQQSRSAKNITMYNKEQNENLLINNQAGFLTPNPGLKRRRTRSIDELSGSYQKKSLTIKNSNNEENKFEKRMPKNEKNLTYNDKFVELIREDTENEISRDSIILIPNNIHNNNKKYDHSLEKNSRTQRNFHQKMNINFSSTNGIYKKEPHKLTLDSSSNAKNAITIKKSLITNPNKLKKNPESNYSHLVNKESRLEEKYLHTHEDIQNYKLNQNQYHHHTYNLAQTHESNYICSPTTSFSFNLSIFKPINESIIQDFFDKIEKNSASSYCQNEKARTTVITHQTKNSQEISHPIFHTVQNYFSPKFGTNLKPHQIGCSPKYLDLNSFSKDKTESDSKDLAKLILQSPISTISDSITTMSLINTKEIKNNNLDTKKESFSQFANLDRMLGVFRKMKEHETYQDDSIHNDNSQGSISSMTSSSICALFLFSFSL